MLNISRAVLFACAFIATTLNAADRTIDYTKLNRVLKVLMDEVVQAAQFEDAQERPVLGGVEMKFEPAASDLNAGKLAFESTVRLNTTPWSAAQKSSVRLSGKFATLGEDEGVERIRVEVGLAVQTDVAALVRQLAEEWAQDCEVYGAHDAEEEALNEAICARVEGLKSIKTVVELFDFIEAVSKKRLDYIDSVLAAGEADADRVKYLTEERSWIKLVHGASGGRKDPATLLVEYGGAPIEIVEGAMLKGLKVRANGQNVSFTVNVELSDFSQEFEAFADKLKEVADLLVSDKNSAEKEEFEDGFQAMALFYIEISKALLGFDK